MSLAIQSSLSLKNGSIGSNKSEKDQSTSFSDFIESAAIAKKNHKTATKSVQHKEKESKKNEVIEDDSQSSRQLKYQDNKRNLEKAESSSMKSVSSEKKLSRDVDKNHSFNAEDKSSINNIKQGNIDSDIEGQQQTLAEVFSVDLESIGKMDSKNELNLKNNDLKESDSLLNGFDFDISKEDQDVALEVLEEKSLKSTQSFLSSDSLTETLEAQDLVLKQKTNKIVDSESLRAKVDEVSGNQTMSPENFDVNNMVTTVKRPLLTQDTAKVNSPSKLQGLASQDANETDSILAAPSAKEDPQLGSETADKELKFQEPLYVDGHQHSNPQDSQAFDNSLQEAMILPNEANEKNIDAIVQNAKTVLEDGGGSMEIHLQPEGLGKVQLKVAVVDGKASVEILAENAQAKRSLEEGLLDIRQALEGKQLYVDTLKVEMSQDYQKDFSQHNQQMHDQQNRDFAEQFLGQFREEREQRTNGLFDGFRSYQKSGGDMEISLSQNNRYEQHGKGRNINWVA